MAKKKLSKEKRSPVVIFSSKQAASDLDTPEFRAYLERLGAPSPTPEKDGQPIFVHQTSWPAIRIALYWLPNGKYQFFEQMMRERGWVTDQDEKLRSPRWVTNQGYETYETESEARGALALFAVEYEET